MPKFNKPIKKADGGIAERTKAIGQARADYMLGRNKPETEEGIMRGGLANVLASDAMRPLVPTAADMQLMMRRGMTPPIAPPDTATPRVSGAGRGAAARGSAPVRTAPMPTRRADVPNFLDRDMEFMAQMGQAQPELMGSKAVGLPSLPSGAPADVAKAAGEIPKTKAGLKKFMQEYGKFIALGAMAGQGGKGGQIAAPIIAALPGLIEMMKGKKKGETMKKAGGGKIMEALEGMYGAAGDTDTLEYLKKGPIPTGRESRAAMTKGIKKLLSERLPSSPASAIEYRPQRGADNEQVGGYWSMPFNWREKLKGVSTGSQDSGKKKSSGGEPPKKSEGGAIRKFKGGSMKGNTKDSMLTPKYKKGGATGEMPQHKKMAMGKPTPQSMKQKFAKGGTMKCASGGVPKGYGISKKIRPTGPMD